MIPLLFAVRISSLGDVVLAVGALRRTVLTRSSSAIIFVTSTELVRLVEYLLDDCRSEIAPNRIGVIGIDRSRTIFRQLRTIHLAIAKFATPNVCELAGLVDLHRSLRSRILLAYLWFTTLIISRKCVPMFNVNKERVSEYLVYLSRSTTLAKRIHIAVTPWFLKYRLLLDVAGRGLSNSRGGTYTDLKNYDSIPSTLDGPASGLFSREPSKLRVGIASDAGHREKAWDLIRFQELARRLVAAYPKIEVVWFAREVVELTVVGAVSNLTGRLTLEQVADEVRRLDIMICNDSGLLHLAEYFGVPVVAIFGPTHKRLGFGPQLESSIIVESSLWCRPCSKFGNKCFRPVRKQLCLSLVTVEDVLAAFKVVFLKISKKRETEITFG